MRLAVSRLVVISGLALVCVNAGAQKSAVPTTEPSNKKTATPSTKEKLNTKEQRREIIFNILAEAHGAAEELPTEQRVAILKDLCVTAFDLGDYRFPSRLRRISNTKTQTKTERFASTPQVKQLKDWSEELYDAAEELPQASYAKMESQTVAVRMMAPVDDKRALEMMDGVESSDAQGSEEQKKYMAISVFSAMLERKGDSVVPELRARAEAMGESGQYPYYAMKAVAGRIEDKESARSIFNDALSSFQHSEDKLNSIFGMLSFLQDEQVRRDLEPWQIHEASLQIANRLKAEIERDQRAYDEGRPTRPGLAVIADSVREGLKGVDPEMAASIPGVPPARSAPPQQSVGDDAPPPVVTPALKKFKSDFEKTSATLMGMSEDEVHGGQELRQTIDRGISQAQDLLRASTQDAKDHVGTLESSMPPVTDFIQVGARTNPAMTLAAVRKVQDSEIRARMLLVIAQGVPDPRERF